MSEKRVADWVLAVLDEVSANRPAFEQAAARRGISLNALVAAAIAGMFVDKSVRPRPVAPGNRRLGTAHQRRH